MMNQIVIKAIRFYQKHLSRQISKLGFQCIFKESCSHYSIKCFQKYSFTKALLLTTFRLISCNPINGLLLYFKKH